MEFYKTPVGADEWIRARYCTLEQDVVFYWQILHQTLRVLSGDKEPCVVVIGEEWVDDDMIPLYQINMFGARLLLFWSDKNYVVSVNLKRFVHVDWLGIFDVTEACGRTEEEFCQQPFCENQKDFSLRLEDPVQMYAFMLLLEEVI